MAVMTGCSLFALVLLGCVSVSVAGEYCRNYDYSYDAGTYCSRGCCGSRPNQYCCGVGAGAIAGSIFSSIFVVGCLIAICCFCARRRRTTIIRTTACPAANVTVVSTNSSSQQPVYAYDQPPAPQAHHMYPPPPAPQPMQPPPYSSTQGAAPAYGYPNPGYPMGQQPNQPTGGFTGYGYPNPGYPMGQQPPQATGGDPNANPAAFGAKY